MLLVASDVSMLFLDAEHFFAQRLVHRAPSCCGHSDRAPALATPTPGPADDLDFSVSVKSGGSCATGLSAKKIAASEAALVSTQQKRNGPHVSLTKLFAQKNDCVSLGTQKAQAACRVWRGACAQGTPVLMFITGFEKGM